MTLNLEGVAEIPSCGDGCESFRFFLSVNDDKLTIRLEDRESKRQWCTPALRADEFTAPTSTIPQATTSDYAKHFVSCLCANAAKEDRVYDRRLSGAGKDGSRVLMLKLKLTLESFCAWLTYDFTLLPVVLEAVDLLAAQVRDLKDEVRSMKQQRAASGPGSSAVFRSTGATEPGGRIKLEPFRDVDPDQFAVDDDGDVKTHKSGSYLVCVTVSGSLASLSSAKKRPWGYVVDCSTVDAESGVLPQPGGCFAIQVKEPQSLCLIYRGKVRILESDCCVRFIEI